MLYWEWSTRTNPGAETSFSWKDLPSHPQCSSAMVNPIFGPYYRDLKTPPANYLSPQPIFFLR